MCAFKAKFICDHSDSDRSIHPMSDLDGGGCSNKCSGCFAIKIVGKVSDNFIDCY
jgi:hypothetical protein